LTLLRLPRRSAEPPGDVERVSEEGSDRPGQLPIDLGQRSDAVGVVMRELSRWGQFVTRSHRDLVKAIRRSGTSDDVAEAVLDALSRDPDGEVVRYQTRGGRPRYRRRWSWEVVKPTEAD
jgi:hypothetical protein